MKKMLFLVCSVLFISTLNSCGGGAGKAARAAAGAGILIREASENVSFRGKNSDGYIYVGQVTLCSVGGISNTFYLFKKGNTKYAAKYKSGPFYSLSDSYVTIDNIKYKTPR